MKRQIVIEFETTDPEYQGVGPEGLGFILDSFHKLTGKGQDLLLKNRPVISEEEVCEKAEAFEVKARRFEVYAYFSVPAEGGKGSYNRTVHCGHFYSNDPEESVDALRELAKGAVVSYGIHNHGFDGREGWNRVNVMFHHVHVTHGVATRIDSNGHLVK